MWWKLTPAHGINPDICSALWHTLYSKHRERLFLPLGNSCMPAITNSIFCKKILKNSYRRFYTAIFTIWLYILLYGTSLEGSKSAANNDSTCINFSRSGFPEENQNIQRYAQIRRLYSSIISGEAGTCGTAVRSPINSVLRLKWSTE